MTVPRIATDRRVPGLACAVNAAKMAAASSGPMVANSVVNAIPAISIIPAVPNAQRFVSKL